MIRNKSDFSLKPQRKGASKGNLFRLTAGGAIYCRFFHTVDGVKREVKRSTGKTQEKEAQLVAFRIFQEETGRSPASEMVRSKGFPSVGRIVDYMLEHRQLCFKRAGSGAVTGYANALGRALRLVKKTKNWKDLSSAVLDDGFVHAWRKAKYAERGLDFNKQADIDLHLNANLNSEWNNVKAVFGRQALLAYRNAGMVLPPQLVTKFLAVPRLDQETAGFERIDDSVDAKMQVLAQAAIHRVRGLAYGVPVDWEDAVPSAKTAVIYELARFCGLTQKEIVGFWRKWLAADLSAIDVGPYTDSKGVNFVTKMNSKNGRVPVNPQRCRWWLEALGTEGEYLLPGKTYTARLNLAQHEANGWIAAFLPDRVKRLHDLRKQAGSDVYRATASLTAAAAFIRDSEPTARKYYLPRGHDAAQFGVAGL